jgi:GR25 family glycosyltransferase involved in LPS biosynthesis
MKAFIIYLKEVQSTVDAALECKRTAREYGIDAWLMEGYSPSRADQFIKQNNLKPYLPGPKLYGIKWNKPGVRGCFVSHYHAWLKCVELNHTIIVLEHDARIVKELPTIDFSDVLQLGYNKNGVDDASKSYIEENTFERKGVKMLEGTHAYAVTPQGAQKLIDAVSTHGMAAADWHICNLFVDIKNLRPRIAEIDAQESLTNDRNFNI